VREDICYFAQIEDTYTPHALLAAAAAAAAGAGGIILSTWRRTVQQLTGKYGARKSYP
jgi:hypothetical protein